jgi:hypothetical protein
MPAPTPLHRLITRLTIPVAIIAFLLLIDLILHPFEMNFYGQPFWFRWLYGFVLALVNMVIGVLCMRRAPGNVIGALLVIYGAGLTTESIRISFDTLLGAHIFFIGASFGWGGFFILVLLFPDGKPYPRWMRWLIIYFLTLIGAYTVVRFFGAPEFIFGPGNAPSRIVANPLFIPAKQPLYNFVAWLSITSSLPIIVLGLSASVILRYRAGSPQIKAQIRWILWVMLAMLLIAVAQAVLQVFDMPELFTLFGKLGFFIVYTLPPLAIGNAILRHNLYDIDIIIRRTLIYSVLTGILAVIYFGGVIVTQQLFQAVTGDTPDIAIVLSTLLIAALFNPIRRRIQDIIDRRLYRRKYDVEQTLAQFNQSLRDEVDVQTLSANLIGVVSETMQPDKIALWVREKN